MTHTRNIITASGEQNPLDCFIWRGMSIDDLRQEVLSVYLDLMIIYIQGVKYEKNITDERGRTPGISEQ